MTTNYGEMGWWQGNKGVIRKRYRTLGNCWQTYGQIVGHYGVVACYKWMWDNGEQWGMVKANKVWLTWWWKND
jgi:hypothetical protein